VLAFAHNCAILASTVVLLAPYWLISFMRHRRSCGSPLVVVCFGRDPVMAQRREP